jgi:hypothetical protein
VADKLSIRHDISFYLRHGLIKRTLSVDLNVIGLQISKVKMHAPRRLGTVRAMTIIGDHDAAQVADAMQAAHLRNSLCRERAQLSSQIAQRRDHIDRRHEHSRSHTAQRLGSQLRSAESQLRYLDRLIARLDHRFGGQLTDCD